MSAERLPIYEVADAVVQAVRQHRVVVVEGAPGTGKTTQLPQILRQAGLAPRCLGVTQPRRIAAVSVAARIAEQVGCRVGEAVGYSIRFDDATSPSTRIKVMTDGILLQEARRDPHFAAYDLLLIDEAHERSLNIDFALGLLQRAMQHHPTLKVVISSATLHPGEFQRFFATPTQPVPLISLKTRTYPLRIVYRPPPLGGAEALVEQLVVLLEEIEAQRLPGDVLVFLPGEGVINKALQELTAQPRPQWSVLPLFGRLTRTEQEQVFMPVSQGRKIILSTNLAETSVTIEGVHVVIDCGLHKSPWHSPTTGITSLREEPISQASAIQRAGRAGRTGPGTVYRLFSEASMAERPEYTAEEIRRVDLSEAVLRLIDLGVDDVGHFAFPTPPPRRKIRAALLALRALGAIDKQHRLTALGRQMVPFPLAPPLSRMVVEARRRAPEALHDVLLVGAFLSVRSPLQMPQGSEDEARAAHRRFFDPLGDAIMALKLYRRFGAAADPAAFCREHFVDADTLRFIGRAHAQLLEIAAQHGATARVQPAAAAAVVRCVACGFAHQLLRRQAHGYGYETLGEIKVALHPSSSLFRAAPRFAVAAELMHSSRVYAFQVSAIEPDWLEQISPEAAAWQPSSGRGAKKGRRGGGRNRSRR